MKAMIQIATTDIEAEKFIRQLSTQDYEAVVVPAKIDPKIHNVHFTINGETSPNYSVTIHYGVYAYIGIRPE
jgi:hypothetical protein